MRVIAAKFNSKCAETGNKIKKGDTCLYDATSRKVYATTSTTFKHNQATEEAETRSTASYVNAQEEAYFDNFNNDYYNF